MPRDITTAAHDRGGDGQLLPVSRTVEVRGEEYDVDIYPATTGQRKEWINRLDDEDDELSEETEADLLDEFADYEPGDFNGAEAWADVRPGITDALGEAILAEIFDTDQDEFTEALEQAVEEATGGNPD